MKYPRLFARYAPLAGRSWLAGLPEEERKAFGRLGYGAIILSERNIHSMGGKARAKGERDYRGRFISTRKEDNNDQIEPY